MRKLATLLTIGALAVTASSFAASDTDNNLSTYHLPAMSCYDLGGDWFANNFVQDYAALRVHIADIGNAVSKNSFYSLTDKEGNSIDIHASFSSICTINADGSTSITLTPISSAYQDAAIRITTKDGRTATLQTVEEKTEDQMTIALTR